MHSQGNSFSREAHCVEPQRFNVFTDTQEILFILSIKGFDAGDKFEIRKNSYKLQVIFVKRQKSFWNLRASYSTYFHVAEDHIYSDHSPDFGRDIWHRKSCGLRPQENIAAFGNKQLWRPLAAKVKGHHSGLPQKWSAYTNLRHLLPELTIISTCNIV